jgi:hypothetical protein
LPGPRLSEMGSRLFLPVEARKTFNRGQVSLSFAAGFIRRAATGTWMSGEIPKQERRLLEGLCPLPFAPE